tara:strand:- start:2169 stop:2471 length:303 start_codon:yes stop_codon:yes gene_type:complete
MKSNNAIVVILIFVFVLLLTEVFLLLTGSKILQNELIISPGEPFLDEKTVEIFGEYYAKDNKSLICRYFNGRKTVFREYIYSPTNTQGLDSCPAFLRPRQ